MSPSYFVTVLRERLGGCWCQWYGYGIDVLELLFYGSVNDWYFQVLAYPRCRGCRVRRYVGGILVRRSTGAEVARHVGTVRPTHGADFAGYDYQFVFVYVLCDERVQMLVSNCWSVRGDHAAKAFRQA